MAGPRIILAGGGTGGHVFPAVAVAQAIEALAPDAEILFVGTERGMEARVLPKLGYTLETLEVRFLKGTGALGWAKGLARLPGAGAQAAGVLWRFKPDAVVSAGGYAAGPVTMLAASMRIPTALMEQNALPGMTNRLLGKVVDTCFLSLPDAQGLLPAEKCALVGNPLRREMLERVGKPSEPHDRKAEFRILITGGSGGAGALNEKLPILLRRLDEDLAARLVVCHQAGRNRAEPVVSAYRGFVGEVEVVEFVDDMASAYAWADLVVCRSGATTLAELLVLGQASMLIPFPGAADNHQEKNASEIVQSGAAVMLRESELDGERFGRLLSGLVHNPEALDNMGVKAATLGRPEAAETVARAVLEMAGWRGESRRTA